jgi:hypothetical protein
MLISSLISPPPVSQATFIEREKPRRSRRGGCHSDILPYAQEHDLVVVTKDCSDFSVLPPGEHEGLILVANHAHSPVALAEVVDKLPDAYPSRQAFGSKEAHTDDWISHRTSAVACASDILI